MAIKLTAYEGVKIQQNHYIEYIDIYLLDHESTTLKETTILSKDFDSDEDAFTIKITNQGNNSDILNVNYVKLVDIDTRYYFVTGAKRLSNDIWQLSLVLDVVNTYRDDILFANSFKQVSIKRRHKDRWKINSVNKRYERIFDKVDEGFDKVTSIVESKEDINKNDYYLVVREIPSVEAQKFYNYSSTLFSRVYSNADDDTEYKINKNCVEDRQFANTSGYTGGHVQTLLVGDSSPIYLNYQGYSFIADLFLVECYCTTGNIVKMLVGAYSKTASGAYTCNAVHEVYNGYRSDIGTYFCEGFSTFTGYDYVSGEPNVDGKEWDLNDLIGSSTTYKEFNSEVVELTKTMHKIDTISKSDSSIKTIINIPVDIETSNLIWWNYGVYCIFNEIITSSKKLTLYGNTLQTINKKVQERSQGYESKLYGSYIRDHYIAYDNYKLPIQPEYLLYPDSLELNVNIPNDMTTNIMIYANIEETSYNNNVLMCSRNNNLSVFTNSYLDYIRNGYNYDEKNKTMNNISNWVSFGTGLVGTGIGAINSKNNAFMGANALSMGINAATSLTNSIMSSIQNEQSLANKRNQILNSSVSMSGSDNLLLFKKINFGLNAIQYVVEAPNSELLNSIWNLFYFTGYADNLYYEVMPKIKTRAYFNYIQADIYQCSITNAKIRNRIIAAYGAGITFEWQYNNTWLCEGTLYENWEESI